MIIISPNPPLLIQLLVGLDDGLALALLFGFGPFPPVGSGPCLANGGAGRGAEVGDGIGVGQQIGLRPWGGPADRRILGRAGLGGADRLERALMRDLLGLQTSVVVGRIAVMWARNLKPGG